MKNLALALIINLLVITLSAATTYDEDGIATSQFVGMCKSELESRNQMNAMPGFCSNYLIGFLDGAKVSKICGHNSVYSLLDSFVKASEDYTQTDYYVLSVRRYSKEVCGAL